MKTWERRAFAQTAFKRLYWQGYKGRFGLFSWPTEWVDDPNWDKILDSMNYDRSEHKAGWSGVGLARLLIDLNKQYPDRVRIMAHSMGNVVASEALRQRGSRSNTPVVQAYVASQAASAAHAYDAIGPETVWPSALTDTPEVYAHFPGSNQPSFSGMANAVAMNSVTLRRNVFNFHNRDDYALGKWRLNQILKPDRYWTYINLTKRWYRAIWPAFPVGNKQPTTPLFFPQDQYEIYAYIAEARSRALGAAERDGFFVRGEIGVPINLNLAPLFYGGEVYEHSAEFNSTLMRRSSYWSQLLTSFGLQP